jgi:hypothetical protein
MSMPQAWPRRIETVRSDCYGEYRIEYVFDIDVDKIIRMRGIQSWFECEAGIEKHYPRPWNTYEIRPQTLTDGGRFLIGIPFECINREWSPGGTKYENECRRINISPLNVLPIAVSQRRVDDVLKRFPFIKAVFE